MAVRVVEDTPDRVVTPRRPGDEVRRRITDQRGPAEHRHQLVTTWHDGWTEGTWQRFRVLALKRKADEHAISLFWPDGSDRLECWYGDLLSGLRSHAAGYAFVENGLDIVVEPDLGSWKWNDEDELLYAVENGVYTRAEADALYAEGERAVARLRHQRADFERWREWRPDSAWPAARLPDSWDAR